jgi:hypothetical protein
MWRAFAVRVLCHVEKVVCYGEIKALLLACNGIAFRGQTQCFFRTIALLLQGVQKGAEIERD